MNKFLFTDGTNGITEVQSNEELESLVQSSPQPAHIRIWVFNSHQWINYTDYRKRFPALIVKEKAVAQPELGYFNQGKRKSGASRRLKKFFYLSAAAAGIFLVFNFTQLKWEKAPALTTTAARPANVPEMDIDSLVDAIEEDRGQSLDRNTRNNLRLRNTWPERILLQLTASRETNGSSSRFADLAVSIDNTTGYNLDNAIVRLLVWKNNKLTQTDTIRFGTNRLDQVTNRKLA